MEELSTAQHIVSRVLGPQDAEEYQRLRLKSLLGEPESFGVSHHEEVHRSREDVARRLDSVLNGGSFIVGAFPDSGRMCGVLGLQIDPRAKQSHKAVVWGMYVLPELRGRGVGGMLLDEVIRRARERSSLKKLNLTVVSSNAPARSLYLSRGFVPFGVESEGIIVKGCSFDVEYLSLKL